MYKTLKKTKRNGPYFKQNELAKIFLRFLMRKGNDLHLHDKTEFLLIKNILQEMYNNRPKNASISRLINVCPFTGRTRGYYNYAHMSRMQFKHMAGAGVLPGFRKASW